MKCLFIINGLGLGNSTRCHALIEPMAAQGWEVHVLTSGNGLSYFQGRSCIASLCPIVSFAYSSDRPGVSGWATLKTIGKLARQAAAKRRQLESLLCNLTPDVAVLDSEYVISPLHRRRIPVVALNTSEVVVTEYFRHWREAKRTRSHFLFVEFMDYMFHRQFCDLVLSPFPLRTPTRHPRFHRIGLVVRPGIAELAPQVAPAGQLSPRQIRRVVFMLSGSVHAANIPFERYELPFQVDVVGRSGESRKNVVFHGRARNNEEILAGADALVINGGYSALSEAFALRKPTFVIPVPGHAEQFINACLARDLGLGFVATEDNVLDQLLERYRQDCWTGLQKMPERFELNGAREAVDAIASIITTQPQIDTVSHRKVPQAGI